MIDAVAIVGPTAVGKSAVADRVARQLDSCVISADSMQIYRGMDIGTAKTPSEERLVPLLMVDVVDPGVPYSAALYQRDARACIDNVRQDGKLPVICGGTGLYLRAALDDMSFPSGELDSVTRRHYDALAEQLGPQGIHDLLAQRDPASAAVIHPHNVKRTIRALEMLDEGISYAKQKQGFGLHTPWYETRYFGLTMERAVLYERIDARVDLMMDQGLLDEVRALVARGLGDALTAQQAIGYKELIDHLNGSISLAEAVELIKMRSRRYAKRQLSWFRRDERITWIDMDDYSVDDAARLILEAIEA